MTFLPTGNITLKILLNEDSCFLHKPLWSPCFHLPSRVSEILNWVLGWRSSQVIQTLSMLFPELISKLLTFRAICSTSWMFFVPASLKANYELYIKKYLTDLLTSLLSKHSLQTKPAGYLLNVLKQKSASPFVNCLLICFWKWFK